MRPDSLVRFWCYINCCLLTYYVGFTVLTFNFCDFELAVFHFVRSFVCVTVLGIIHGIAFSAVR